MAFQPVPTYQDPVEVNPRTGKSQFSPTWLSWFLSLSSGGLSGTIQHNVLLGLQGGSSGQYYHLTLAQYNSINYRVLTAPAGITVGASPFLYHNTSTNDQSVIVKGGTVSKVEFSRDNTTFFDVGVVAGMFTVSKGDYLRVTYTVAPTMTGISR